MRIQECNEVDKLLFLRNSHMLLLCDGTIMLKLSSILVCLELGKRVENKEKLRDKYKAYQVVVEVSVKSI